VVLTKAQMSKARVSLDKNEVVPTAVRSRFGRNIKKNRAINRESCVYGTPEEIEDPKPSSKARGRARKGKGEIVKDVTEVPADKSMKPAAKATKSILKKSKPRDNLPIAKPQVDVSLRRTVIDKFRRSKSQVQEANIGDKETDSLKVLSKISLNPKTIKDRQQNAEALAEYNKDHEDDFFSEGVSKGQKLLKQKKKPLLNASDSESENEVSIHSARTPTSAYMRKKSLDTDKTPMTLAPKSPMHDYDRQGFQNRAYIHKKIAENAEDARKLKRMKLKTAVVSKVVSRARMDAMIDESSKVIRDMTAEDAGSKGDDEDDGAEDWFEDWD